MVVVIVVAVVVVVVVVVVTVESAYNGDTSELARRTEIHSVHL